MRNTFYLLLLIVLTACGQKSSKAISTEIDNKKTSEHINIPGTRLYIIPPRNFEVSKTFTGLQKGEGSMINVYELTGGNFYTNAANFNKAGFEKQGAKVFDYKELEVNGYPAKYISMQGDPQAKVYGLVFGDSTFSIMIMGVYPTSDELTGLDIIKSLNSINYDKSKKVDPFETASFILDDKSSTLKFYQFNANLYMYTPAGKDIAGDSLAPFVIVTPFPKDNSTTSKMAVQMMIDKAKMYGMINPIMKNETEEQLNGYETYQVEVHGEMQGSTSAIYMCAVSDADKTIAIQGVAKKDIEENLKQFRNLAYTIKIK